VNYFSGLIRLDQVPSHFILSANIDFLQKVGYLFAVYTKQKLSHIRNRLDGKGVTPFPFIDLIRRNAGVFTNTAKRTDNDCNFVCAAVRTDKN